MSDGLERITSPESMKIDQSEVPHTEAPAVKAVFKRVLPGDPLPWLKQRTAGKDMFAFDTMAGRYQLFCFFLDTASDAAQAALKAVHHRRHLFDDLHCSFIGVTIAPQDEAKGLRDHIPGVRFALDFDYALSKTCGAVTLDAEPGSPAAARRFWMLVDPSLHVVRITPLEINTVDDVLDEIGQLSEPDLFGGVRRPAPILLLPNVFDQALCTRLIHEYDNAGGVETGVQRQGQGVLDASFKRRRDHTLTDPALLDAVNQAIGRRVLPEIEKLFFMKANHIERHIVGCYSAADGGHFAPHRDNREGLTAHRRFAVSINLNAGFSGGEVIFPEYNMQGYKAPPGWAVVFPCAILHRVRQVTAGARYAFLPFVYDEGGHAIRQAEHAKAAQAMEVAE